MKIERQLLPGCGMRLCETSEATSIRKISGRLSRAVQALSAKHDHALAQRVGRPAIVGRRGPAVVVARARLDLTRARRLVVAEADAAVTACRRAPLGGAVPRRVAIGTPSQGTALALAKHGQRDGRARRGRRRPLVVAQLRLSGRTTTHSMRTRHAFFSLYSDFTHKLPSLIPY